jgi:hypothetical protein
MSDDDIDCDGTKDDPTRVPGTGKELLGWLKPGRSTGSSEEQSTDESSSLDRRTYMLMAGGAAAAAIGGTAGGSVSASGTAISQPDLYGYGGGSLKPDGQVTTLHSVAALDSVTEVEDNDERATAMEISPGVQVDATLETATVDWFVFGAQAGDPITIEYDRVNDVGITGLILYGPDGNYKNKLWVGTGSPHTFEGIAETSGDHYFQVIDVTDGAGDYSFSVWLQDEVGETTCGADGSGDGQQPYEGTCRTIPGRIQAENYDEGGQGVAYYDTGEENLTGLYRPDEFVDIEESGDTDDGYSVGFVGEGEWLEYTLEMVPGTYELSARVATDWQNLSFDVSLDGAKIATVDVPDTDGWYSWETVTAGTVDITESGTATVRVDFTTGGTNLNWIQFESVSDGDDGGTSDDDDFGELGFGEGPYGGTDA